MTSPFALPTFHTSRPHPPAIGTRSIFPGRPEYCLYPEYKRRRRHLRHARIGWLHLAGSHLTTVFMVGAVVDSRQQGTCLLVEPRWSEFGACGEFARSEVESPGALIRWVRHAYMPPPSASREIVSFTGAACGMRTSGVSPSTSGHRIGQARASHLLEHAGRRARNTRPTEGTSPFSRRVREAFEIWRADADGIEPGSADFVRWPRSRAHRGGLRTGTQIACDTRPGPHPNIHIVSAEGGPARRPFRQRHVRRRRRQLVARWALALFRFQPQWFRGRCGNERWMAGSRRRLQSGGGFAALEAPDGRSSSITPNLTRAASGRLRLTAALKPKFVDDPPKNYWGYFAVGSDGFYFIGDTGTPLEKAVPVSSFLTLPPGKLPSWEIWKKVPIEGAPGLVRLARRKESFSMCNSTKKARNSLMMAENFH